MSVPTARRVPWRRGRGSNSLRTCPNPSAVWAGACPIAALGATWTRGRSTALGRAPAFKTYAPKPLPPSCRRPCWSSTPTCDRHQERRRGRGTRHGGQTLPPGAPKVATPALAMGAATLAPTAAHWASAAWRSWATRANMRARVWGRRRPMPRRPPRQAGGSLRR